MKKPPINVKELNESLTKLFCKLTTEERNKISNLIKQANECIKNDDQIGLNNLQKNG